MPANFIWSEMGLVICLLSGIIMSLLSNNMFLVWVGLELKMFGMVPFLSSSPTQTKNMLLLSKSEVKVSFYYFFMQVMGSLFFCWGFVLGDWMSMSLMGLLMKLGAAPFFWWVPPVFSRLDWISIGVLGTIQKIPGILLMRLVFDLSLESCMMMSLMGLMVSAMGIKFSFNKLKQLMSWSSMSKMSFLILLIVIKSKLGVIYYLFYSILSLCFCMLLSKKDSKVLCNSFIKGENFNKKKLASLFLLIFSGLPPLLSFILKIYFLGGLYKKDMWVLSLGFKKMVAVSAFIYVLTDFLKSWSVAFMFLILMTVQSVGYIKAFMKMNSTGSSRLSFMSKNSYSSYNSYYMIMLMVYLCSMLLMWL